MGKGVAVEGLVANAARYKPERVNNRPSDVIAPRDTSVAFKWLLSRLCLDAAATWIYGIPSSSTGWLALSLPYRS